LVVHSAAKVGGIQANIENPVNFLLENLQMDSTVISSSLAEGVRNFVYIGSSCMYPKDYRQPFEESDLLQAPVEPTNEGYALAKITGSKLCEYASNSIGVNYKTVIPSNLYGPGDNFDPYSSHLLASVVRKVHDAKLENLPTISVWGSGTARREFTFVDDVAGWIAKSVDKVESLPSRLNLGSGKDYSVDELYQIAMQIIGHEVPIVHDESRPEGMRSRLMDSSMAKTKFGWTPTTDIATGISKTYKAFLSKK
jgi:GDP-L-fucose synthase